MNLSSITGTSPNTLFKVRGVEGFFKVYKGEVGKESMVDSNGVVVDLMTLLSIIDASPEGITPVEEFNMHEYRSQLKSLYDAGARYIASDYSGRVYAYRSHPRKRDRCWTDPSPSMILMVPPHFLVVEKISWEDPQPLNIRDALDESTL